MKCPICPATAGTMIDRPYCSQLCRADAASHAELARAMIDADPAIVAVLIAPGGKVYQPTDLTNRGNP